MRRVKLRWPRALRAKVSVGLLGGLACAPLLIHLFEQPFYLELLSRVMILGLAALSLNLILGYGGMVSLGHAAYLGIGAYCVGIAAYHGVHNGFVHLALGVGVSAAFALVTGALCLRTKGVYFIMITLAFAQMLYFMLVSLEKYGGDDGLVLEQRSQFAGLNLDNATLMYYLILGMLALGLLLVHRLVHSRFGRVIIGSRHNPRRMQALGYRVYRYQLVCYVLAAVMCGVAGVLLGNFTDFISPDMLDWTRSGELLFMVVVGGSATLFGPLLGAGVFILLEEWLSALTQYWHFIFGLLLIVIVVFGKGGVYGWLERRSDARD